MKRNLEVMKSQKFGVEVEMNNISRERAVRIAAGFFGTDNYRYTGDRNEDGYFTWSAFDAQGRKWKFSRDVSIVGPDNQKCELVTPILSYEDIETLQELLRRLRKAGAKSDATRGCGIHIHVDGAGHTPHTIRNLVNLMTRWESLLKDALNLDDYRVSRYCSMVNPRFTAQINAAKPKTMGAIEDMWYSTNGADYGRTQHYNESRYHMLNLHSFFHGHGTIEFRLFQFDTPELDADGKWHGGIHAGQLKAYIQFCLAISQAAKEMHHVTPKQGPVQKKNPKAGMMWLLKEKLGLDGEEFETMRMFFTKNLKTRNEEVA